MTGVSIAQSLRSLIRRLPLAVIIVLAGLVGGYLASSGSPGYASTAVLFVGTPGASASTFFDANTQEGQTLLAVTYAQMVVTPGVIDAAIGTAHVPRTGAQAMRETKATPVSGTGLFDVTVTDHSPQIAAQLANAVAAQVVKELATLDPVQNGTTTTSPVAISQAAVVSAGPLPSSRRHDVERGGAFGLVVAVALLAVLEYRDRRPSAPPEGSV